MGLVIQIGPKDTFNIAERRFRLIEAFPETNTAHIQELGEEPLLVSYEKWTKISGSIALRLTQVSSRFSVKVDIEAPQTIPIWRNGKSWVEREDVALLAPVPIMHLESGLETVQQYGRVAFGSMAWEGSTRSAPCCREGRARCSSMPRTGSPRRCRMSPGLRPICAGWSRGTAHTETDSSTVPSPRSTIRRTTSDTGQSSGR